MQNVRIYESISMSYSQTKQSYRS